MCGIVGIASDNNCIPALLSGLRALEYRGYDSSGLASSINNHLTHKKSIGKISNLIEKLNNEELQGNTVIAHTRWATHGKPSLVNAHPFVKEKCALVHNGIIENHQEIRNLLEKSGHKFLSQTDSECISHLIENYLDNNDDIEKAIIKTANRIKGANVVLVISNKHPNKIFCFRIGSAGGLIIAHGDNEMFVSSDIPAIIPYASSITYLSSNEIAIISSKKVEYKNIEGISISKKTTTLELNEESISKGEFKHFMLKEIHDQPQAMTDAIGSRVSFIDNKVKF